MTEEELKQARALLDQSIWESYDINEKVVPTMKRLLDEVGRLRALAARIADAATHCRMCRECGDGSCCAGCDVEAACSALAKEKP